jgi:hypothetical protein
MRGRKRQRKKLHRRFLTTICGWVVTFDDDLRQQLLASRPGAPFLIEGASHRGIRRLLARWKLRYFVTVVERFPLQTAAVVYWAAEFPKVRDELVIFSNADLGRTRRSS